MFTDEQQTKGKGRTKDGFLEEELWVEVTEQAGGIDQAGWKGKGRATGIDKPTEFYKHYY